MVKLSRDILYIILAFFIDFCGKNKVARKTKRNGFTIIYAKKKRAKIKKHEKHALTVL